MAVDAWRKIREDGATGLIAVLNGVAAAFRGGRSVPETLRLRWRLRDTRSELGAAYAELGRLLADALNAGTAVPPTDEAASRLCRQIDALLAEERRLVEDLAREAE